MSVNLVTLGLFFALSVLAFVPSGQVLPALIDLRRVHHVPRRSPTPGLISVMPRAGGDYVWQSRVLGGGIAFVLAVTGLVVHPVALGADLREHPQRRGASSRWPRSSSGRRGHVPRHRTTASSPCASCTIVLAGYLVSLGMEGYAKRPAVLLLHRDGRRSRSCSLVMLFGSQERVRRARSTARRPNLFGAKGDVYEATLDGGNRQRRAGDEARLLAVLRREPAAGPVHGFWILWPNWGATLYGEVRGAERLQARDERHDVGPVGHDRPRRDPRAAHGQVLRLAVLQRGEPELLVPALRRHGGADDPDLAVPAAARELFFHNAIFQAIVVLAFGAWFLGWAGTLFLSSTRVDLRRGVRPDPPRVGRPTCRSGVTCRSGRSSLMLFPSIIVSAFYAYKSEFITYILDATLVIAVTFFGTAIAAMILPWRKKSLYAELARSRSTRSAGIPLITVPVRITALFLGWNLYQVVHGRPVRDQQQARP